MDTDEFDKAVLALEDEQRIVKLCPADKYRPHAVCLRSPFDPRDAGYDRKGKASGQLQFHQSAHPVRVAAPGNGWGGTTAMACEVDAWVRGLNRWQKTPEPPIVAVWFAPESRQFAMVLAELRKFAFGPIPRFYESGFGGAQMVWPNESVLYITTYDRGWQMSQGTQPDIVAFDEQPPEMVWREMLQRRREVIGANRPCRFICKATQTGGWSWMADDIYVPWLKFHQELGLNEEQALAQQLHPDIWCWSRGSIHDNAAISDATLLEYERRLWPSVKERKVRLYGGFENWVGDPVFDPDGLDWQRNRMCVLDAMIGGGIDGQFVLREVA